MKDDKLYLHHILDAINDIQKYIRGLNYDQFAGNSLIVDAVIRKLEIIGEAAKLLSRSFVSAHPEIPVRDMADTRNKLIHEYFGVEKKKVWETCKNDLPELKSSLKPLLD
ncbi:MAG: DUF86 domain-containing protein [Chloroflexi bacterium]|nr:DUF86 domain-containing protein [Chloroflexota bacterium]